MNSGDLASYMADIRRRARPPRRWYWPKNADRPKAVAYLLEYNPATLGLRAIRYIKRRRMLAPLMTAQPPIAARKSPSDFSHFREKPNSYEIRFEPATSNFAPIVIPTAHRKLILFHAFYEKEFEQIMSRLEMFDDCDVILTTPNASLRDRFLERRDAVGNLAFLTPNRGRDVLPMLLALAHTDLTKYTHFVKIHTKRSSHHLSATQWFTANIDLLIGSTPVTDAILSRIDPVRPSIYGLDSQPIIRHSKNNRPWLNSLLSGESMKPDEQFIPGTMFAGSAEFLRLLAKKNLHLLSFESEAGQLDGCLVHAMERHFGHLAISAGGACGTIDSLLI